MVEISHQQSRYLLQMAADAALPAKIQALLDLHLSTCHECREYAHNLSSLEDNLRKVTRAQWDIHQPHIDLQVIRNLSETKNIFNFFPRQLQNFGMATLMIALALGYFLITNIGSDRDPSRAATPTRLPDPIAKGGVLATPPTPSAQINLTGSKTQNCGSINYIVQESDTLERIANLFGISKDTIISTNLLIYDNLTPGDELNIPLCNITPSYTASVPTTEYCVII